LVGLDLYSRFYLSFVFVSHMSIYLVLICSKNLNTRTRSSSSIEGRNSVKSLTGSKGQLISKSIDFETTIGLSALKSSTPWETSTHDKPSPKDGEMLIKTSSEKSFSVRSRSGSVTFERAESGGGRSLERTKSSRDSSRDRISRGSSSRDGSPSSGGEKATLTKASSGNVSNLAGAKRSSKRLSRPIELTELARMNAEAQAEKEKADREKSGGSDAATNASELNLDANGKPMDTAPKIDVGDDTVTTDQQQSTEKDSRTVKREARRSRRLSRSDLKAGLEAQLLQAKEGASGSDPSVVVETEAAQATIPVPEANPSSLVPSAGPVRREKRNSKRLSRSDLKEEMKKMEAEVSEKRKSVWLGYHFFWFWV
jgi:hypothetical protein